MSKTDYYNNHSRFKHPEITEEAARDVIRNPVHIEIQTDGLIRHFGEVTFADGSVTMYARVVTLDDGYTLVTAHPDGAFTRRMRKQQE